MAKTKATITGLPEVEKNLKLFIKNSISEVALLNEVGEEAARQIKKQTQAGLGEYKQPKLKDSTIEARRILLDNNNGSSGFAKPARSNLTLTGQLLESISFKVSEAKSTIVLFLKDSRYKIFPISKDQAQTLYNKIIDNDNNATNAKRRDPKDKARIKGIFLASKKPEDKTNTEIMQDLDKRGFKFFFISERLQSILQSKIRTLIRQKLSNYKKLKRSLK